MENRRKFYTGGLWSTDTLGKRYEHIKWALDAYNSKKLDKQELKFIIKNAFVSKIYVSEEVFECYNPLINPCLENIFGADLLDLYKTLINNGILRFEDKLPNCVFFDICKLSYRISSYNNKQRKSGKNEVPPIIVEHVIPSEEYMRKMINREITNLGYKVFKDIFDVVSICLVTKGEDDDKLSKNGLRQNMPDNCKYENAPFARYEKAGIKLHGWSIKDGNVN